MDTWCDKVIQIFVCDKTLKIVALVVLLVEHSVNLDTRHNMQQDEHHEQRMVDFFVDMVAICIFFLGCVHKIPLIYVHLVIKSQYRMLSSQKFLHCEKSGKLYKLSLMFEDAIKNVMKPRD